MNCRKVQALIPLAVGNEIPTARVSVVKAHLEKCPRCQQEYQSFRLAIMKTKEWLTEDRKDWEEGQWQQAVQQAIREVKSEVFPLAPRPFKKVWAYVMMAVLVAALGLLFVIGPSFIQDEEASGPGLAAENQVQVFKSLAERPEQDVISMTLVSKESGLKIVWFFDKNFDLEEKK